MGGSKVNSQSPPDSQDVASFMSFCFVVLSYHHSVFHKLISIFLDFKLDSIYFFLWKMGNLHSYSFSHFSPVLTYTHVHAHTALLKFITVTYASVIIITIVYYVNIPHLYCYKHINILYRTVQLCERSQKKVYNPILVNSCGLNSDTNIYEIFLIDFSLFTYSSEYFLNFYCWLLFLCLAQNFFPSNFSGCLGRCICLLCHLVSEWSEMLNVLGILNLHLWTYLYFWYLA